MPKSPAPKKRKATKDREQEPLSRQLGERILALREARGWSLDALATASGVPLHEMVQSDSAQTRHADGVVRGIRRRHFPAIDVKRSSA